MMEEEEQEFLEKVQMEMHLQKDGKKYVLTNRQKYDLSYLTEKRHV